MNNIMTAEQAQLTLAQVRAAVKEQGDLPMETALAFGCFIALLRRNKRADRITGGSIEREMIDEGLRTVDGYLGKQLDQKRKMARVHDVSTRNLLNGVRVCSPDGTGNEWWDINADAIEHVASIVREHIELGVLMDAMMMDVIDD